MSAVRASRSEAILEAALGLIGERGPQAVTHRAVAAAAGVSLGAITHHFASRDALVEEALRHLARREIGALERLTLDLVSSGFDPEAWMAALSAHLAGRTRSVEMLASYELLLECARNPGLRDVMAEWTAAQTRVCVVVLREAGARAPEEQAPLMLASISGLILKQLAYPRDDFAEAVLVPSLYKLVTALVRED